MLGYQLRAILGGEKLILAGKDPVVSWTSAELILNDSSDLLQCHVNTAH